MGRPWTFGRVLACLLVVLIGSVIFAAVGGLVGTAYGGNRATDFEFDGRRGYEATGRIGFILGFVAGGLLAGSLVCFLARRR